MNILNEDTNLSDINSNEALDALMRNMRHWKNAAIAKVKLRW